MKGSIFSWLLNEWKIHTPTTNWSYQCFLWGSTPMKLKKIKMQVSPWNLHCSLRPAQELSSPTPSSQMQWEFCSEHLRCFSIHVLKCTCVLALIALTFTATQVFRLLTAMPMSTKSTRVPQDLSVALARETVLLTHLWNTSGWPSVTQPQALLSQGS